MAARSRNNIVAGVFVLGSMVLAVAISVWISGLQQRLAASEEYVIRFSLDQGAAGLKSGSPVQLGGQDVGRVVLLEFTRDSAGSTTGVDVLVAVRKGIVLYEDAIAFLERPLLGSQSSINIVRVGDGTTVRQASGSGPRLEVGERLEGMIAPPSFLAQAGYGPEQARQIKVLIEQAGSAVDRIDKMAAKIDRELDPDLAKIRTALDDVSAMTAEFRQKTPGWTAKVDSVLAQADGAAADLRPVVAQLKAAADEATAAVGDVRQAIEANRPGIDRIVANVDDTARRLKEESVDLLNAALVKARDGAGEFEGSQKTLAEFLREQTPNLRHTLANFRLASDQIKLAGIEVRRNPWRLLYSPKTKELESEVFYDAARAYAEAVSDLRAASESLEAASARPASREAVEGIAARLNEAFKRYDEAEKVLLKRMTERK
ncbi:MAG: MlaD family protein [Phycisphaerales bacterium]